MANNPYKKPDSRQKQKGSQVQPKKEIKKAGFWEKTESYLKTNQKKIFWILFSISVLVSLLMFNAKITVDGDDSVYIKRAYDFVKKGVYPSFQGPLYPFLLSIIIYFSGINLLAMKFLSVIFATAGFYFTYRAFRDRIPYTVLFSILVFTGTNYIIHFYSSQTYTEAFYMFLQALGLFYIFKVIDATKDGEFNMKQQWQIWLMAGLFMFLMSITKNVAVIAVAALMFYFIIMKQYLGALYSLVAFLVFRLPFSLFVRLVFGPQQNSQMELLKHKEFYNPAAGNEDFSGYMDRFFTNFNHYISKHFFKIINFRPEDVVKDNTLLTVLFSVAFLAIMIMVYRKNKHVLFTGIYTVAIAFVTFIVLQVNWDQTRIILIIVPLLLLILLYGFYELSSKKEFFRFFFIVITGLILILNVKNVMVKIDKNLPVLKKNLKGDMYYGFTPDWVNFLKMSKWCSDNLPEKSLVGSRKPGMSFVYGNGKSFYGIAKVESNDADTLLSIYKKAGVSHFIVASLRADPRHADPNNVISTVHRIIYAIYSKYPGKIKEIHKIGDTEPAYLYEIKY